MIAPPDAKECCLLLAKAANDKQLASVGNQTRGRVGFFLFTDDFWRDYHKMVARDIHFVREATEFEYGMVAVFEDLYGNLWNLIQPNEHNKDENYTNSSGIAWRGTSIVNNFNRNISEGIK